MKKVLNFVIGKKDDKREKTNANISVEITNPLGQKVPSEDEHIIGLQSVCGYDVDLSGKDKSITKLHKAAWQGNLEKIKIYLKRIDINTVDDYSRTPLHLAAAQGHNNVVCFLLNNKAVPDIRDSDGMTPFLKAVECGIKECVATMLERGVFTSETDHMGNTALHITAKQGFFNIMSMLLKNGAFCDSANNLGEMPLHIATEQEHRDLVEVLLQSGAQVNVLDQENRTPLMLAARVGQASIVSLLLKFGANTLICDINGCTARDYALIGGHEQLALELMEVVTASNSVNTTVEIYTKTCVDDEVSEVMAADCGKSNVPGVSQCSPERSNTNVVPISNILLGDEEAHDSPRSCETPPPLNPPRSWEIIQAGMIDQTQVRRRSLMALGTLESHRESFVENGNSKDPNDPTFLPNIKNDKEPGRNGSDMDWDSDDSLPLDRSLPPPPEFPDSSLDSNLTLPEFILTPDSSIPFVPELIITPDRRSRITLERTPSLDLTDSDNVDCSKVPNITSLERDDTSNHVTEEKAEPHDLWTSADININKPDEHSNLNCDTNLSNILIEENANYILNQISKPLEVCAENEFAVKKWVRESCSLDNLDEYSESKNMENQNSQSCDGLDSERFSSRLTLDTDCSTNEIELTQSLDSLEDESLVATVVKKTFHESHSLELLDEVKKPLKQHARMKSMSVSSCHWSKSVDMLSKPGKAESLSLDRKRIDAQLQCYDEALRELAEEQRIKEDLLNKALERKQVTKCNFDEVVSCEIVEPRVIITQKSCNSPSYAESASSKSIQGCSLDSTNHSNFSSESYKHFKKANSITHVDTKCNHEDINKINKNIMPKLLENNIDTAEIKSTDPLQIDSNEQFHDPINHMGYSSKQKSSERSFSEDSNYRCNNLQSDKILSSSLELPSLIKDKEACCSNNVFEDTDWENPTVSSAADQQNDFNLSLEINVSNPSENVKDVGESHKAKQCVKRFLKKEKSESHIKKRSSDKTSFKKIGRSLSLQAGQSHCEKSLKSVISEGKKAFIREQYEKSESDSDWSERPVENKRKQFVAMRGVIADSDDSNDEDADALFVQSSDRGGFFTRQDTVIYNQHTSSKGKMNDYSGENAGGNDGSSSSDSGSISISHSEASLSPSYTFHSNSILKEQLKQTIQEKAHLEESIAKLKEETEKLQYKLADANQSIAARDDKLVILQDEVTRLSTKYSATLDEFNSLKHQFMASELELKHLKELIKINHGKEHKKSDSNSTQLLRQLQEASKAKKIIEFEKETLIAQHVMDLKKLQQDTIHWKNLYEDAISRLEQIEVQCGACYKDNNQHIDNVQSVFKKIREGKISDLCKLKDVTNPTSSETKADASGIDQVQVQQINIASKDIVGFDGSDIGNQVATLQLLLQQEKSKSSSLDSQVKKMLVDLQNKIDVEAELESLKNRLEKDFVPRVELEILRASQENAIGRIQQQALIKSDSKLHSKLTSINDSLKLQLEEQMQIHKQKELMETQLKQEFENTRQKLLLELSLVQATLKAKESEQKCLQEKCEALAREVEKAQELKRRQLIEKSYNVNLVDSTTNIEKELSIKETVVPLPPPLPSLAPVPPGVDHLSTDSLRQQLEMSIAKHKDIQLSVVTEDRLPSPPGRSQQ